MIQIKRTTNVLLLASTMFFMHTAFSATATENKIKNDNKNVNQIYFAGGCFWGVEEYFSRIPGVVSTTVGYANGTIKNPTYEIVLGHKSGYAETVHVKYDATKVSLNTLVTQFFKIINPISKNQQGNDKGNQYRTGIYYVDHGDKKIINEVVTKIQGKYSTSIVTEILPLQNYYLAEEYHQKYLKKNPNGYCHISFDSLKDLKK